MRCVRLKATSPLVNNNNNNNTMANINKNKNKMSALDKTVQVFILAWVALWTVALVKTLVEWALT